MNAPFFRSLDLSMLRDRSVQRRIALATLLCAAGGVLYALFAPRWYRSAVTLVPAASQKSSGIAGLLGGDLGGIASGLGASVGGADIARIGAVLESTFVSDAAIEKFDLRSRYGQKYLESARSALWEHCSVKPLVKPGLVQLSCEDKDPRFVQELLAFLAEFGNQAFRRVNRSSASEEVRFLERRVTELRGEANDAASRVREFQEEHQIVDLDSQAKAVVSSVSALNMTRIAKQMELEYARGFSSPDEAGTRQLESQLSVLNDQLRDMEQPRPGRTGRTSRDQGGRGSGAGMFPVTLEVPRLRAEYERLMRDRKVAEATLVFSLDRLEGARAAEARDVSTFVVLDPPPLPTRPSRPARTGAVALAALVGLILSVSVEWWRSTRTSA
jgi:capsule polysaccharide export protein KpsE/RkpR